MIPPWSWAGAKAPAQGNLALLLAARHVALLLAGLIPVAGLALILLARRLVGLALRILHLRLLGVMRGVAVGVTWVGHGYSSDSDGCTGPNGTGTSTTRSIGQCSQGPLSSWGKPAGHGPLGSFITAIGTVEMAILADPCTSSLAWLR